MMLLWKTVSDEDGRWGLQRFVGYPGRAVWTGPTSQVYFMMEQEGCGYPQAAEVESGSVYSRIFQNLPVEPPAEYMNALVVAPYGLRGAAGLAEKPGTQEVYLGMGEPGVPHWSQKALVGGQEVYQFCGFTIDRQRWLPVTAAAIDSIPGDTNLIYTGAQQGSAANP